MGSVGGGWPQPKNPVFVLGGEGRYLPAMSVTLLLQLLLAIIVVVALRRRKRPRLGKPRGKHAARSAAERDRPDKGGS